MEYGGPCVEKQDLPSMRTIVLQLEAARAALPSGVQVEEVPQDDAWFRDSGPIVRCLL